MEGYSELDDMEQKLERISSNGRKTRSAALFQNRNPTAGRGEMGEEINGYTVKRNDSTSHERYVGLLDEVVEDVMDKYERKRDTIYRILDVGSSLGVAPNGLKIKVYRQIGERLGKDAIQDLDLEVYEMEPNPEAFGLSDECSEINNDELDTILSNPVLGVGQGIPYEEDTFDLSISNQALTPLTDEEKKKAVDEIQRVTDSDGAFYISTGDIEFDISDPVLNGPLQGKKSDAENWEI